MGRKNFFRKAARIVTTPSVAVIQAVAKPVSRAGLFGVRHNNFRVLGVRVGSDLVPVVGGAVSVAAGLVGGPIAAAEASAFVAAASGASKDQISTTLITGVLTAGASTAVNACSTIVGAVTTHIATNTAINTVVGGQPLSQAIVNSAVTSISLINPSNTHLQFAVSAAAGAVNNLDNPLRGALQNMGVTAVSTAIQTVQSKYFTNDEIKTKPPSELYDELKKMHESTELKTNEEKVFFDKYKHDLGIEYFARASPNDLQVDLKEASDLKQYYQTNENLSPALRAQKIKQADDYIKSLNESIAYKTQIKNQDIKIQDLKNQGNLATISSPAVSTQSVIQTPVTPSVSIAPTPVASAAPKPFIPGDHNRWYGLNGQECSGVQMRQDSLDYRTLNQGALPSIIHNIFPFIPKQANINDYPCAIGNITHRVGDSHPKPLQENVQKAINDLLIIKEVIQYHQHNLNGGL